MKIDSKKRQHKKWSDFFSEQSLGKYLKFTFDSFSCQNFNPCKHINPGSKSAGEGLRVATRPLTKEFQALCTKQMHEARS